MSARLGTILDRIGRYAAILFAVLAVLVLVGGAESADSFALLFALLAVASWLAGRVARYVFAPGPRKSYRQLASLLYRLGRAGAFLFAALAALVLIGGTENARSIAALFALLAFACWLAGRVLQYVFTLVDRGD